MGNSALTRRKFLSNVTLGTAGLAMSRLVLAADAMTDSRFVLIILRGALDGLAAVPAYGDGSYAAKRGALAITSPTRKLDGLFALHPSFAHLHEYYQSKQLLVFHAVASPYRDRSHFDGQDCLENGTDAAHLAREGWLNRALQAMPEARTHKTEEIALALSQNVPLVLRGDARVNSWAPSRLPQADADTLDRIADLYSADPYFAQRLHAGLTAAQAATSGAMSGDRDPLGQFLQITTAAGRLLSANSGARVAVIEASGWDTHANQGAEQGQLANRLRALDSGIASLGTALGAAWDQTAVLVVTEFGRTVAVNGTRGTDHGTGMCALLAGGAVNGGRVLADWPGLATSALYQQRDLRPTQDLRAIFKGVLREHLKLSEGDLDTKIFPASAGVKPIEGLIRKA
ncbi:MAG: DUF1501 domain-containing protein [Povalibacter sp.]